MLCIWMNGLPVPNVILSLLSCDCKRWCVEGKWACIVNGIKCTDMCNLKTCDHEPLEGTTSWGGWPRWRWSKPWWKWGR